MPFNKPVMRLTCILYMCVDISMFKLLTRPKNIMNEESTICNITNGDNEMKATTVIIKAAASFIIKLILLIIMAMKVYMFVL